ncbi:hypothetical protein F0310_01725 [Borrelia sp. A-FGy1]|uniref:hypothetical protein n=1 Tax=Borrelia sp. A-FGy1 TaxID=2608247 RepID=UPI0015F667E7|nr:hypothetical protein [Borrelia sp. A-FGy1]QMU99605.1 hypothetical protein F0310_01725 [Borrelia sp. A-FGy1]
MLNALKFIFLVTCRFIVIFFILSFVFLFTFYLKYKFLYVDFSIFSWELYYDTYVYAFPLALVITFMRISYPFSIEVSRISKTLYFITFIFILSLSYFGFKSSSNFNSMFNNLHQARDRVIRDGIVHFFDGKLLFYSNDVKFFGFKGLLKVEKNENNDNDFNEFSYSPYFSQVNTIYPEKDAFLIQKLYSRLISYVFNDLETLNNFFLSLGKVGLIFNIFGFGLLLFSFSYIFNLVFSSNFSLFLYPIFIILFFKVYNIYAIEFPKNFNLILGENVISDYIPFIFCILTFFSIYLFGFISDCIKINEGFDNNL